MGTVKTRKVFEGFTVRIARPVKADGVATGCMRLVLADRKGHCHVRVVAAEIYRKGRRIIDM